MGKIMEMITELADSVDEEYRMFYANEVEKDTETVFEDSHKIDIYRHLCEFFTDTPEEYLSRNQIECLLQKKGRILEELCIFVVDSMNETPYGTYEDCEEIVTVYIENGF